MESDPMVMLLERVEKLEWALEHVLGRDNSIINGIRVCKTLSDQKDAKGKSYMLQLTFSKFPYLVLVKAFVVAHAAGKPDISSALEKFLDEAPKSLSIQYTINDALVTYILECFSRFHRFIPESIVEKISLVSYTPIQSSDIVATWLIKFSEDISYEALTQQIHTGFSKSGFDYMDVTLYPVNDTVIEDMMPFADMLRDRSIAANLEGPGFPTGIAERDNDNDNDNDNHNDNENEHDNANIANDDDSAFEIPLSGMSINMALALYFMKRMLPFYLDFHSDVCSRFLDICMKYRVSPGSFDRGRHPCIMEDFSSIISMIRYYKETPLAQHDDM